MKVKVRRELISAVLNKTEPLAANDSRKTSSGGLLSSLFGGGSKQVVNTTPAKESVPEKKEKEVKSKPVKSKPANDETNK